MNTIKNTFWHSKEGSQILVEFGLFVIQILAVTFLLNLTIGRSSGDVDITSSELIMTTNHQKIIKGETNTLDNTTGKDPKIILSSVSF